ncbi:hypothetical protein JW887_01085 [Candidatus Dojkabacteria bacterium]|nr:hypothetical protein [Candidatus Dojkabacteria bacterium]
MNKVDKIQKKTKNKTFTGKILYPILIVIVGLVILFLNFDKDVRLSGWDNHQSELDFILNIQRSFFHAWDEYQGVGMATGMAMEAELPKQLITFLLSLFIPNQTLRFMYFGICYITGPLGIYFLLCQILNTKRKSKTQKINNLQAQNDYKNNIYALLAGLFYMMNIHTLQTFYAPLEMFTAHFAAIPWIIYFTNKYQQSGSIKILLILTIVNFLGSTQFITPTFFATFGIIMIIFTIYNAYTYRQNSIRKFLLSWISVGVANAYWLLPTLFFLFSGSSNVLNSKISEIVSPDFPKQIEAYGTFENFALMRNFWFSNIDWNGSGWELLMGNWPMYLDHPLIKFLSYIIFATIILGIIGSFITKPRYRIVFYLLFIICFIALFHSNPPTGPLFDLIMNNSKFISELFRATYTKFNIMTIITFSYFFAVGLQSVGMLYSRLVSQKVAKVTIAIPALIILVANFGPAFQGYLFYSRIKTVYPEEYQNAFKYFEKEDENKRILLLPFENFSGWHYYNWGYRGSGFWWYKLKQPITDRAFDVWSPYNETLYNEFLYSVKNDNQELFQKLLDKYDITYVIYDKNIAFIENNTQENFLANAESLNLDEQFGNIQIYKNNTDQNLVQSINNYDNVIPSTPYITIDQEFQDYGNYISYMDDNIYNSSYLYKNLERGRESEINIGDSDIIFKPNKDNITTGTLRISDIYEKEPYIPIKITFNKAKDKMFIEPIYPQIFLDNKIIEYINIEATEAEIPNSTDYIAINNLLIDIDKTKNNDEYYALVSTTENTTINFYSKQESYSFDPEVMNKFLDFEIQNCRAVQTESEVESNKDLEQNEIEIIAKDASACFYTKIQGTSNQQLLVDQNIQYTKDNELDPSICFQSETQNSCQNTIITKSSVATDNEMIEHTSILPSSSQDYFFRISLDTPESNDYYSVTIKDIQTGIYYPFDELTIDPMDMKPRQEIENLEINEFQKIEIRIPKIDVGINETIETEIKTSNPINNSDKGKIVKDVNGKNVKYTVTDTTSLDVVKMPRMIDSQSYIVFAKSENISGKALKLYLSKEGEQIATLEEWADGTFIKIPEKETGRDYFITIGASSFSPRDEEINILEDIEIFPIQYNWLKSLKVTNTNSNKTSDLKILDIKKHGSGYYSINTSSSDDNGVISISQGYDKNWIAIQNGEIIPHVKVNNWSNGWIIPRGNNTIYIIFIPQIFQWFGYLSFGLFILICSIILLVNNIKNKRKLPQGSTDKLKISTYEKYQ